MFFIEPYIAQEWSTLPSGIELSFGLERKWVLTDNVPKVLNETEKKALRFSLALSPIIAETELKYSRNLQWLYYNNGTIFTETFENLSIKETFLIKFNQTLSTGLEVGLQTFVADIYGAPFADTTRYQGQGPYIAGQIFIDLQGGIVGLFYKPSLSIPLVQQGEKRQTPHPGWMGIMGQVTLISTLTLEASYFLWRYSTDDLYTSTTSQYRKANIDLRGLSPEKDKIIENTIYAGMTWNFKPLYLKLGANLETYDFIYQSTGLPGIAADLTSTTLMKGMRYHSQAGWDNDKSKIFLDVEVFQAKSPLPYTEQSFGINLGSSFSF
jgi:hypothetical protein